MAPVGFTHIRLRFVLLEEVAHIIEQCFLVSFNLESSVGQGIGCLCGGVGQGVTARNGHSLSSSYNAAMRRHRGAIYPVAPFTCRVKVGNTIFLLLFICLLMPHSGQLRILGSKDAEKNGRVFARPDHTVFSFKSR